MLIKRIDIKDKYCIRKFAKYKEEIYNMPFNMNTFNKLWRVIASQEASTKINKNTQELYIINPQNLEE